MATSRQIWIANIEEAQRKIKACKMAIVTIIQRGDVNWIENVKCLVDEAQALEGEIQHHYALIGKHMLREEREAAHAAESEADHD